MSRNVNICGTFIFGVLLAGWQISLAADSDLLPGAQLEEIVITAQKRSENLQDVPISITAISSEALDKAGVVDAKDIQYLAPGLNISAVGSGFVSYTYIRGGGTDQIDPGSDPSVAYFLDEVYLGGTAGLQFDLVDVDRIEVLKGPQGTLFGRNAASGAISITSKEPSPTFGGSLEVDAGNYDYTQVKASITGPITADDHWLYRAAFDFRRREGYTTNLVNGDHVDDVFTYGGRGEIEYVVDDFKFLLSTDLMGARNGGTPQFLSTARSTYSLVLNNAAVAAVPGGEASYAQRYDVPGYENQNLGDVVGRLEWTTDIGKLTSISAFRTNTFDRLADYDTTAFDSFSIASQELDQTFSQEIRLSGDREQLHWIGGLYYYHAQSKIDWQEITGPFFPLAGVPFAALGVPVAGAYPLNNLGTDDSIIYTNSQAAFGQLGYDFTNQLTLTVGGRYSEDRKHAARTVLGLVSAGLEAPPFSIDPHGSWSAFDPSAALDYKITEDVMTYLSYRQGFKSGGFQPLFPPTATVAATPFAPEKVKSYEGGLKSEWFDRRFLANVAVFLSNITDQQISQNVTPILVVVDNAGATRDYGVDLTLDVKPIPQLILSAAMTVQHARFKSYVEGGVNYAGDAQLRSPDLGENYGLEYDLALAGGSTLALHAAYSYESRQFYDIANSTAPGLFQPGYGIANARVEFSPVHGDFRVGLWGNNLGNTHYYQNIAVSAPAGLAVPGVPRTYGVAIDYNFH